MIVCPKLKDIRKKEIFRRLPNTSIKDKTVRILFLMKKQWSETLEMIIKMWTRRREIMEDST